MSLPMMIESLVAILLLCTILYCVRLNSSIKQFKGQEHTLKATIAELITATENAKQAIAGLRTTVREAEQTLGVRLMAAEKFSAEIAQQLESGEAVLKRLAQIATLRPIAAGAAGAPAETKPPVPDTRKIMAAAKAFAERARTRLRERAA
ncbi:MAG TPA: DUF6468 domain-containing protein [Xanthobacteraceae bacterium]|nr:DUF6468 domain-containing protein [Xanthobacteraceae bacterium]